MKLIGVERTAAIAAHTSQRATQPLARFGQLRYRLRPAANPTANETMPYGAAIGSIVLELTRLLMKPTLPPTHGPATTPAKTVPVESRNTGRWKVTAIA